MYYDPFDHTIDDDPYPVWRRMREEAPLYRNDKYNFYALSRYDDVVTGASGLGDLPVRPGNHRRHPVQRHRGAAGHPAVRGSAACTTCTADCCRGSSRPAECWRSRTSCADSALGALDPLLDGDAFDFVADLGAIMPMRTIGYLLGIPEEGQEQIRQRTDDNINTR